MSGEVRYIKAVVYPRCSRLVERDTRPITEKLRSLVEQEQLTPEATVPGGVSLSTP